MNELTYTEEPPAGPQNAKRKKLRADARIVQKVVPDLKNPYEAKRVVRRVQQAEGAQDQGKYGRSGKFFEQLQEEVRREVRGDAAPAPKKKRPARASAATAGSSWRTTRTRRRARDAGLRARGRRDGAGRKGRSGETPPCTAWTCRDIQSSMNPRSCERWGSRRRGTRDRDGRMGNCT